MKKLLSIFGLTIIVLSSCVTQKKCLQKFPPSASTDSVYIEKVKEVPVYLPGDTVNVEIPVSCPDQDLIKVENSKLKQEILIIKGKLISKLTVKPDTVKVPVIQTIEKIKEVKVPEPVKYVPKIAKAFAWIGGLCIALLIAYISRKFLPLK